MRELDERHLLASFVPKLSAAVEILPTLRRGRPGESGPSLGFFFFILLAGSRESSRVVDRRRALSPQKDVSSPALAERMELNELLYCLPVDHEAA